MHEPPKDADRLYLHRADEVETDPNSLARLQTRLEFKKKVTKKLKNNMGLISKQNNDVGKKPDSSVVAVLWVEIRYKGIYHRHSRSFQKNVLMYGIDRKYHFCSNVEKTHDNLISECVVVTRNEIET